MKVKLSAYEKAINTLNKLSPKHDKIISEALEQLRSERNSAQAILKEILELYPYINCVCGRGHARLSEELRKRALENS